MNIVGYISGVFDCLHEGHVFLLTEAKKRCDRLIVSINSDEYVQRKKGRTVVDSQAERASKLLSTGLVYAVVYRKEDSPLQDILIFKPDYIFVGDDYPEQEVVGYKEGRDWGCKVVIIPRIPGISTTEILQSKHAS